jgi:hypothetical protein
VVAIVKDFQHLKVFKVQVEGAVNLHILGDL